jgi:hypothetical protein
MVYFLTHVSKDENDKMKIKEFKKNFLCYSPSRLLLFVLISSIYLQTQDDALFFFTHHIYPLYSLELLCFGCGLIVPSRFMDWELGP